MKTNIKMIIITVGLFILAGCKPAAKEGVRSYSTPQRTDMINGNNQTYQTSCPSGQSAIGTIYDTTYTQTTSFEERVKLFLSAAVDPTEIGTISSSPNDPTTGVRFQGVIKIDANGNVNLAASKLSIKVYDSLVNTSQGINPIPVDITTASAGQFNVQSGQGYVVFKDSYGEIRLDGKIDQQYFSGTISYTNYQTVVPNSSPASGHLGQFYITTCGIIQR